jgi:hypothetical protein
VANVQRREQETRNKIFDNKETLSVMVIPMAEGAEETRTSLPLPVTRGLAGQFRVQKRRGDEETRRRRDEGTKRRRDEGTKGRRDEVDQRTSLLLPVTRRPGRSVQSTEQMLAWNA